MMIRLTDTHCHIHEESYPDPEGAYQRAMEAGVQRLICVGTDEKSSREAVAFARGHENVWASVGLHPHDVTSGVEAIKILENLILEDLEHVSVANETQGSGEQRSELYTEIQRTTSGADNAAVRRERNVVAIGECGLDYFYDNSPREKQIEMLHAQLALAQKYDLPVIFHVRESFDDFWSIFSSYKALRGVLHSFTDNMSNLTKACSEGLFIGVNGISTFAKDKQETYAAIPQPHLLLETDAPFLTPVPHRGTLNEPAFITLTAQYIANLQSISLEELSRVSERNATTLFFSNK